MQLYIISKIFSINVNILYKSGNIFFICFLFTVCEIKIIHLFVNPLLNSTIMFFFSYLIIYLSKPLLNMVHVLKTYFVEHIYCTFSRFLDKICVNRGKIEIGGCVFCSCNNSDICIFDIIIK